MTTLRLGVLARGRKGEWVKGRMGDSEITNYELRITNYGAGNLKQRLSELSGLAT